MAFRSGFPSMFTFLLKKSSGKLERSTTEDILWQWLSCFFKTTYKSDHQLQVGYIYSFFLRTVTNMLCISPSSRTTVGILQNMDGVAGVGWFMTSIPRLLLTSETPFLAVYDLEQEPEFSLALHLCHFPPRVWWLLLRCQAGDDCCGILWWLSPKS